MFDTARLRLTVWYLAILAGIVGVLSLALYHVLVRFPTPEIPAGRLTVSKLVAILAGIPNEVLAWQIVAVDLGVLILAALGAYVLAGRTLQPLEAAMARQQRFAAAASHELRTPLTVLQGSMEVALLRRRTPEEYEQVLRDAVADVHQMAELVADLLALVRAERATDALNLVVYDLTDLAREAVEDVRPLATGKGQSLQLALDGPLPVRADAVKLRQVIANLLDNAVTYTPDGGAVRLLAHRDGAQAALEVHDTGPGIAPRHLPHLFDPFYRADASRDRAGDHVGLGLAMAAWIVQAHGGRLSVESHVGAGSVFRLMLPLVSETGRRPPSVDAHDRRAVSAGDRPLERL